MFPHWGRQPLFDDRQYLPIDHSAGDTFEQRAVRDRREIVAKISIYHFPTAMLRDVEIDSPNSHLRIPSGSKPVLLCEQVRFEDRTEYQHHGGLDHAVLHRRHGDFILHLTQQGFKRWVAFAFCVNDLRDRAAPSF